jgi:NAD(P)-dependent dehydrogenase (short-subunit alcohol dehydrogenase family)
MTRAWAAEFSPAGVRVNAITPGPVYSDGGQLLEQPIRTSQRHTLLPSQPDQLDRSPLLSRLLGRLLVHHIVQRRGHHGTVPTGHTARRVTP